VDGHRVDFPFRSLSESGTRRGLTRCLGGLTLAAPFALYGPSATDGKGKRKKKRKKGRKGKKPTGLAILPTTGPVRKTVTRTFDNGNEIKIPAIGTTIGPAAPYATSYIEVTGFTNGRILDVNVTLQGFNHEIPEDVDILLTAQHLPGQNALVMSDAGGLELFPESNLFLTLDDQAAAPLSQAGPLVHGTFKPANYTGAGSDDFPFPAPPPSGNAALSVFNGINPNGIWYLFVVDDFVGAVGNIWIGWSLEITAEVDG
jgi:hypothetical protein